MHVHDPRTGFTAQYLATRYNRAAILKILIDAGFDPDGRNFPDWQATETERFQQLINRILPESQFNKVGEAPLHVAAQRGYTNSVRVLLAAGATVEAEDWDDSTPLSLARAEEVKALLMGNKDIGDLHLSSDADTASRDWQGRTPLHRAATEAEAKALLADEADPHARDNNGQTPLHHASTESVARALIAAGADPAATDRFGQTPLHTAANEGVVSALLAAGADPNALYGGRTPLYRAATEGVARALIAAGVDPNAETTRNTLLLNARSGGAVTVLVEAGLDPNAETTGGYTPLHSAQTGEAAQALLDAGADPLRRRVYTARSARDTPFPVFLEALSGDLSQWEGWRANGGRTLPLHSAIQRPDVVRVLLEADVYDPANREHVYDPRSGYTTPSLAADVNQAKSLQLLIDAGFDPDARNLPDREAMETEQFQQLTDRILPESQFNTVGKSALHIAAQRGGANSVRVLLAAGATVDAEDWGGTTPLQVASTGPVMELLIDAGANPHVENEYGETLLHRAPTAGVVERLLNRGVDPNAAAADTGDTPLHTAATADIVRLLLEAGADPNAVNEGGDTPLMDQAGTPEAVKLLLDAGASSSAVVVDGYWTPLRSAVLQIAADSVRFLLEDGAPFDTRDENGETLLHEAATGEIVRLLLEAGIDPDVTNDWGDTPLHQAPTSRYMPYLPGSPFVYDGLAIVEALLEADADPNVTNNAGVTPLSSAVAAAYEDDRLAIVDALLEAGADPNTGADPNSGSGTPMHIAASHGNPGILRSLLAHGATVDAKDQEGETPLFEAMNLWYVRTDSEEERLHLMLEMTEILLEAGADPNAEADRGDTPLTWAERLDHDESVLKLLRDAAAEREPVPAFEPQRISIMLGLSGDTVVLMTTESGGFTLEGRMFESGGTVTAGNGNQYTLTMDANGGWTAEYLGVTVMLGTSGLRVLLRRMDDGSYRAGERPIKSGDTILGYTLTMNADGTWTAVGP